MKKKIFFILAFVILSKILSSQTIPNSGFENWTGVLPDQWSTMNPYTGTTYTAAKSTAHHGGTYSLKLTTKTVSGIGLVRGLASTGTINHTGDTIKGGYPFNSRPAQLTGWFEWMSASGTQTRDSMMIVVNLFKHNNVSNKADTIATGIYYYGPMVMSFTAFTVNLNYLSGQSPDTAQIIFASSYIQSSAIAGSYLNVDDIAWAGNVTGIENNSITNCKPEVYPVPANDMLLLRMENPIENCNLIIYDQLGRKVSETVVNGKIASLKTSSFENGIYLYSISDGKKILTRGKFVVRHKK